MSKKFVRSVKNVTDIEQFSKNVLEENDIISTQDGKVYIKRKTDYVEVSGVKEEDLQALTKRVGTNETLIKNLIAEKNKIKSDVETLTKDYKTLSDRVTALETPETTE